jgi:hypothetical protein
MMASTEGYAHFNSAHSGDILELKESYRRLLRAIDRGELEVARHLMNVIDSQQSQNFGLSDGAQEAFDRLAIAATTEDLAEVRDALVQFRSVLRSNSTLPPSSMVCPASPLLNERYGEEPQPSRVSPRYEFEDFSLEAFDQELPETASVFALKRTY